MKLFALVLLSIASGRALNILSIFPYHGKSHFLVFKVLLHELARKGHNVTVISHFPDNNPLDNYHDISLAGTIKILENHHSITQMSYLSIISSELRILNEGVKNCEIMMANERVRQLVKEKRQFDVVLMEQFNSDCGLGIAFKLKAPVVGATSHVLLDFHYQRLGVPSNPAYVSNYDLEGGTKPTLFQKIERIIFRLILNTGYSLITQRNNQNTLAKYFDDIPPLEYLAKEIKFMLLYHYHVLTGSKLFPANVIEVGGYHVTQARPLSGDLKTFIEEADHGIIYISFGSSINSSSLPANKVEVILSAMKEFPQRFIWKWEDETRLVRDKKVYMAEWLPQVDILGNSKTLAFFSHAGMGGMTEAVHFGVPMVAMPILGDQPLNAAAIEESGLGIQLQYRDLTKDNLVRALKTVLDPKFRAKAKQLSAAWHDRPMPPLDTAVFWIEFAAKHSNFTFRTAAADTPTYQYINLDVICVFSSVVVCIYGLVLLCLRLKRGLDSKIRKKKN